MHNQIDLTQPVATTVAEHPEILPILVDLGFKPLANPMMRETIGKTVSLKQGAKLINIPLKEIIQTLQWNGYEVIGETNDS